LIVSSGSTSPGGSIAGVDAAVTNTGGSGASNAGATVSTGGVTAPGGTTGSGGSAGSTGGSEADGGTAGNSGAGGSGFGGSGGSGVKPFCAKNNSACRCSSTPFTLGSHDTPAENCDNPGSGSGTWACAYDLNSAGESTICSCTSYVCDAVLLQCQFACGIGKACFGTDPGWWRGAPDAGVAYCFNGDPSSPVCGSSHSGVCPSGYTTVAACTTTPPEYTAPPNTAVNCAGLNWLQPDGGVAPAPDGGATGCTLTHCGAPTFGSGSKLFEFVDPCCTDGSVTWTYTPGGQEDGEILDCGNVKVTCSISGGGCHDSTGASCTF
jgi:hypothetical protein